MIRTSTLEADLATVAVTGATAATVVALPPSDLDPPGEVVAATTYDALTTYDASTTYFATYTYGQMRVYVGGSLILRSYDPEMS